MLTFEDLFIAKSTTLYKINPLIRCYLFLKKEGYMRRHFGNEQGLYIDRSFDKFIIEP